MEDYREIGPPGNGETQKTGASNLAAVRETTRHVRIHASRVIFEVPLTQPPSCPKRRGHPTILRLASIAGFGSTSTITHSLAPKGKHEHSHKEISVD